MLCNTSEQEATEARTTLCQELYSRNLIYSLIENMTKIDFEVYFTQFSNLHCKLWHLSSMHTLLLVISPCFLFLYIYIFDFCHILFRHTNYSTTSAWLLADYKGDQMFFVLVCCWQRRKDVVAIFNALVQRQIGKNYPTVDHICQNPQILTALMTGWVMTELMTGWVLQSLITGWVLTALMINDWVCTDCVNDCVRTHSINDWISTDNLND